MIIPRGIIQRLEFGDVPRTLWLRHNPALFAEDEWIWTQDSREAFIFATYEEAQAACRLLVENGETHVHPVVHREKREETPVAAKVTEFHLEKDAGGAEALSQPALTGPRRRRHSVSAEEAFTQLERRHLA